MTTPLWTSLDAATATGGGDYRLVRDRYFD